MYHEIKPIACTYGQQTHRTLSPSSLPNLTHSLCHLVGMLDAMDSVLADSSHSVSSLIRTPLLTAQEKFVWMSEMFREVKTMHFEWRLIMNCSVQIP